MNFVKTKKKGMGVSLIASLALSLSLAATTNTVLAANVEMTDLSKSTNEKVKPGVSLANHIDPKRKDQAVIYNTAQLTIAHQIVTRRQQTFH